MNLTYHQQIAIWHSEVEENTYVMDLLSQVEEVWEKVVNHPSFLEAQPLVDKNPIWKDLINDAEMDVGCEYAYKIYLAVKEVVENEL